MQLSEELARLLSNLGRTLAHSPSAGLSNRDYTTLVWLENRSLDGCRLSDLADGRGYDTSTMSRRVAHLVGAGPSTANATRPTAGHRSCASRPPAATSWPGNAPGAST